MSEVSKIFLLTILSVLLFVGMALAGPYSDSAHGDKVYGVKRQVASVAAPGPYATGNCAHCHEQHASIDGQGPIPQNNQASAFALFAPTFNTQRQLGPYLQSDLFCFYCHSISGSLQAAATNMGNYDYSRNFGGLNIGGPNSILDAYNQSNVSLDASYHNLYDIWKLAQKYPAFETTSAPCDACHNPHRAKRNRAKVTDPTYTAISLPDEHESLWGDQPSETMASYNGRYQPPLYAGAAGGYEPGGVAEAFADGSQLPDYNRFCLTCHKETVYSSTYARNMLRIDWSTPGGDSAFSGDKHGMNTYTQELLVRPPYSDYAQRPNDFLLSCVDCHEPHGSANAFLLRRGVNGSQLSGTVTDLASSNSFGYLCRQCHQDDYAVSGFSDNAKRNRWEEVHHSGAERPYDKGNCTTCHVTANGTDPIGCFYCHGHSSYVDATHPGTLPNGKTIPAPNGSVRRSF